jgi:hypothetical protein
VRALQVNAEELMGGRDGDLVFPRQPPIAQWNTGPAQAQDFLSWGRVDSPFALRVRQIAPAAVPIAFSIARRLLSTNGGRGARKAVRGTTQAQRAAAGVHPARH